MSETPRIVRELREHDHPQSQCPVRSDGTPIVRVAADTIGELYEALAMARQCIACCRRSHPDAQSGTGIPVEVFIDAALAQSRSEG